MAVGQRFTVDPWLEDWIREIYEPEYSGEKDWIDDNGVTHKAPLDGDRVVRRAALLVARKNAKSYAVAGLLLCHLVGPLAVPNGQIYSCAIDREQAKVVFRMCAQMIRATPSLSRYLKVTDSQSIIAVTRSDCAGAGSRYRALSADSTTKHGLGPDFFVYDEFGEASDKDDLWNTMFDGQQLRHNPLAVAISTQNNDPQHPFSIMLDDGLSGEDPTLVCHLHAADEDCDLDDRAQWLKANPACATWKPISPIATAAAEALRLPSKEQNFRRRYLNQRVSQYASLITASAWKECAADFEFEAGEKIFLGLDLSGKHDLTALVAVSAGDESRVKSWFWKPADFIGEHSKRDRVRYDLFQQQGHLIAPDGPIIHPEYVAQKIIEIVQKYNVVSMAYDRYFFSYLIKDFDRLGFHASATDQHAPLFIVPWGQGTKDMAPAVDALETDILCGKLKHDQNPLLTMCMMNAQVVSDAAGARKFDKDKSRMRIDGAVAMGTALGLKHRTAEVPVIVNPYDDPDFSIMKLG